MKHPEYLLFDLDGTLTDSKPGIIRSFQYALAKLGQPQPPSESMDWCIGPPLRDGFARLLQTNDKTQLDNAVRIFRERYSSIGMFESNVFPGVRETLAELQSMGLRLYLATSKLTVFANTILEHFQLANFFTGVYGCELDGKWSDKGDLLAHLLQNERFTADAALMIGDRRQDMLAAKVNSILAGGVLYGYGTEEELSSAGADYLFRSPEEITNLLRLCRD